MVPRKLTHYIFVAAAALLLLGAAQPPQAAARKFTGVNPFCRTASYRRVCTQMVGGAANQHDATVNAIKYVKEMAQRLRSLVPSIEPAIAHLHPNSQESIRLSCVDNFDGAVYDFDTALESLEAGDIYTVKSYLSAAASQECADAMKEFGIGDDYVLTKYSAHLTQQIDNCLAVLLQT